MFHGQDEDGTQFVRLHIRKKASCCTHCRSWCFDAMVDRAHHQKHAVGSYSCACLVSCVYVYRTPRLQWQKLLRLNPLLIKVVSWACWYLFFKILLRNKWTRMKREEMRCPCCLIPTLPVYCAAVSKKKTDLLLIVRQRKKCNSRMTLQICRNFI